MNPDKALDLANVLRFPPRATSGIAILRMPRNPTLPTLEKLVAQFLEVVDQLEIENQRWIIEPGRIRVHQSGDDDS